MKLIKCPVCGEEYSDSYPSCPFCEEAGETTRKIRRQPRRRIADKSKAQSARGAMIGALVLVLALVGWYLFGSNLPHGADAPADKTPDESMEPSIPASAVTDDPFLTEPDNTSDETPGETPDDTPAPVDSTQPTEPPVDENADVSNAKLNRSDFTLSYAGETFRIKLSGTEATPRWSVDNGNVVQLAADGTVTAVANGNTTVHCKVGTKDLTCTVRVRNTGKSAAAAEAPTVVTPAAEASAPSTPATPAAQTDATPSQSGATQHVDAASLRMKTNLTGVLPRDGDTKKYDCTVSIGGDVIRLIIVDENGKELSASWKSDNTSVAEIGADGTVKPLKSGKSLMTASVGDATVDCIIRVR